MHTHAGGWQKSHSKNSLPDHILYFIWIACIAALLAGCTARPAPVTEISVLMRTNHCEPGIWRVPAGEIIIVHFTNQDAVDHSWILLFRSLLTPQPGRFEDSIYFRQDVPAGRSVDITFRSPAAAGNYPMMCASPELDLYSIEGRLTVVGIGQTNQ
jgi:hypothetical protein